MRKYSLERVYRVWDNQAGDYVQISDDDDGLDLMKISTVMSIGPAIADREINSVFVHPDSFDLFLEAITMYIEGRKADNEAHEE